MAQPSSAPDYIQPPTPQPSPAPCNGFTLSYIGLTGLPTQILKVPARLAIECYHCRKLSEATPPKATLYEYSRKIADELNDWALYILSIFTLNVNASVLLPLLLQQTAHLVEPTIELAESEYEELSNSFLPDMIDINCAKFCARFSRFVGVELEEGAFEDMIRSLLNYLDYSLTVFLVSEVS